MYQLEGSVVHICTQATTPQLQNERLISKKRTLFVERVFWLNFWGLIGCTQNWNIVPKKDEKP
jgi:hypothetical protein